MRVNLRQKECVHRLMLAFTGKWNYRHPEQVMDEDLYQLASEFIQYAYTTGFEELALYLIEYLEGRQNDPDYNSYQVGINLMKKLINGFGENEIKL